MSAVTAPTPSRAQSTVGSDGAEPTSIGVRTRELQTLLDHAQAARSGGGRVVLIEGDPGAGKTWLVEELARRVAPTFHVLRGRGDALEASRALGPLRQALGASSTGPLAERIARRQRRGGLTAAHCPPEVVDAMLAEVERRSAARPVVLVIDDVDLADRATVQVLCAVIRRTADLPMLLVLTAPTGERGNAAGPLAREVGAARGVILPLGDLTGDEVAALAERDLGRPADPELLAELAAANGNPLLVTLLLEMPRPMAEREGDALALPPTTRQVILHKLAALPPEVAVLLPTAAVLGQSFTLAELSAVTSRPLLELLFLMQVALDRRVLVADGPHLRFRHGLVWSAIYAEVAEPLRGALHHVAGLRLVDSGSLNRAATHLLLAARMTPSPTLVPTLRSLARELATAVPATARDLLQAAAELADHPDARDEALTELVPLLTLTGQAARAITLGQALLARGRATDAARVQLNVAHALLSVGRADDGAALLRDALRARVLRPADRQELLGDAAFLAAVSGALDIAADLAAEAVATPLLGVPARIGVDLVAAIRSSYSGDGPAALAAAEQAVLSAAHGVPNQVQRFQAPLFLALAHLDLDHIAEADEVIHRGLPDANRWGYALTLHAAVGAWAHYLAGRWDDALAEVEPHLGASPPLAADDIPLALCGIAALIHLERGDPARAASVLPAVAELRDGFGRELALLAQLRLAVASGRPDQAVGVAVRRWGLLADAGNRRGMRLLGLDCVRLAVATGRADFAAMVASDLADVARTMPAGSARAAAELAAALVDPTAGGADRAMAAVDLAVAGGRPVEAALVRVDAAARLRTAGRRIEAVHQLRAAADTFHAVGARVSAERVAAELRALGVRRAADPGRGVAGSARPAALTSTERRVLALLSEGMTNQQLADHLVVSRRTVETHLQHIYAKTGLNSRLRLAAAAARLLA